MFRRIYIVVVNKTTLLTAILQTNTYRKISIQLPYQHNTKRKRIDSYQKKHL